MPTVLRLEPGLFFMALTFNCSLHIPISQYYLRHFLFLEKGKGDKGGHLKGFLAAIKGGGVGGGHDAGHEGGHESFGAGHESHGAAAHGAGHESHGAATHGVPHESGKHKLTSVFFIWRHQMT